MPLSDPAGRAARVGLGHAALPRAAQLLARLALALPFIAAAAPAGLRPGMWEVTSAPGQATLDGRPLTDLPYTPPAQPEAQCIDPHAAANPAALIARQVPPGCTVTQRQPRRASIAMAGTCPPQAEGLAAGSFALTARWTADHYLVQFTTTNPSENGRMGFTGTIEGKRVGACPG